MQAPTALRSHLLVAMGGPPLSPSFMHMQSTHQPIKPHSYIVIRVFGGEMLVEYPPNIGPEDAVPPPNTLLYI